MQDDESKYSESLNVRLNPQMYEALEALKGRLTEKDASRRWKMADVVRKLIRKGLKEEGLIDQ